jgi:hypothetical protein
MKARWSKRTGGWFIFRTSMYPAIRPIACNESAVGERAQADMDAQAFFPSVLNDSLEGYRVVLITEPKLPAWAKALGADSVQVHSSVGNRQWVLLRSDR